MENQRNLMVPCPLTPAEWVVWGEDLLYRGPASEGSWSLNPGTNLLLRWLFAYDLLGNPAPGPHPTTHAKEQAKELESERENLLNTSQQI